MVPVAASRLVLTASLMALLVACSKPRTTSDPPRAPTADATGMPARTEPSSAPKDCSAERAALAESVGTSAKKLCVNDSDCAVILEPASHDQGPQWVVHRTDSARLQKAAERHLEACFRHYPRGMADLMVVVEPRCVQQRCVGESTTFHIGE
jgi:hypothetical protein